MWILWAILILCAAVWAAVIRRKQLSLLAQCNLTECSNYLPFVGHALQFFGSGEHIMKAIKRISHQTLQQKDGVLAMWMGSYLHVFVADPVNVEFVLKSCLEKGDATKFLAFVTGNGSAFAPVAIWRHRRKIVVPSFSPKRLEGFVRLFATHSATMARLLRLRVGKAPFSIWPYLTSYTFDSICETTLNINLHSQEVPNSYLHNLDEASKLVAQRMVSPWLYSKAVYRYTASYSRLMKLKHSIRHALTPVVTSLLDESCNSKMNATNPSAEDSTAFVDILGAQRRSGRLSAAEVCEEALILLLAGTDTSAVGGAFTALMLARHPQVQKKVYEEIREVFGDSESPMSHAELPKLSYLECVIKETLRLYPPAPVIARKVDRSITLPTGQRLPRGCNVVVPIYGVHRNPAYWGADAARFRPERFLEPLLHPAQFMPFSYGPRNCAGYKYAMMSMKTALATLLRQYQILPSATPTPLGSGCCLEEHQPLNTTFSIMMKDVNNFTVQLKNRN